MLKQEASVISVQGNQVEVEVTPALGCGGCSTEMGCGITLLGSFFPQKRIRLTTQTHLDLQVGNKVVVGIPEDCLLSAAALLYLAPLLGLFGGAFLAQMLSFPGDEMGQIITAVLGFFLTLLWLRARSQTNDFRYHPVILGRK